MIRPAWDIKEKDLDVAWNNGGYTPGKQFACLVIDRDDGGLKILQASNGIFKNIRHYQRQTGNKVYADVARDWEVRVMKVRGQDGRAKTEYSVVAIGECKLLTAEEKERIANFTYDWRKLFVWGTSERIHELYVRLTEADKINPER